MSGGERMEERRRVGEKARIDFPPIKINVCILIY